MPHRRKGDHKPRHNTHAVKPANLSKPLPWEVRPTPNPTAPAEIAANVDESVPAPSAPAVAAE